MNITVILCTYNRSESLSKALESLAASTLPDSVAWEVLVVDNNSSDRTREVTQTFCDRYPGQFRYLFEPQPGKSYALNAGIRESQGDILAFVDDDVTVEPTWLQNLTGGLSDGLWAGAGGKILPQWTCSPPNWLPLGERYALAPLAMFDLGVDPVPLMEPPFGTNMAFLREVFEKYGGFRTDLGPRPDCEIRNEDTEFGSRLLTSGEQLRYEPSAVVFHAVPQTRLQKPYFLRWWFDKARADIREVGVPNDTRWFFAGIPLYVFRRLVRWTLKWWFVFEPSARFGAKIKVWGIAGMILECHRLSRQPKPRGECDVRT